MTMYATSPPGASHRSMGIMQELQKYIAHVESLAAHRKMEIEKLNEEKRDLEKLLRLPTDRPALLKAPTIGEIRGDEPSQVKFLLEDIRVLKDRVRKYKERSQSGDRQIAAQQNQILRLQDRVATLEGSLQMANRTETQISEEQRLAGEVEIKDKEIRDLRDKVQIAQRSREADARRHKNEAQELRKESAGLKKEVARLAGELEERNKEIRMDAMKIRSLRKKLDPIKRQLNQVVNQNPVTGDPENYSPTASVNGPLLPLTDGDYSLANPGFDFSGHDSPREETGLESAVNSTPGSMREELRRLQALCQAQQAKLARLAGGEVGAEENGSGTGSRKEVSQDEAAVLIQKALRGYAERKNYVRQKSAAMRIQAQLRGHQVRKRLKQQASDRALNPESLPVTPSGQEQTGGAGGQDGLKLNLLDGGEEERVSDNRESEVSPGPSPTKEVLQLRQSSATSGNPTKAGSKSPVGKPAGRDSPHGPMKRSPSNNGRNSPTVKRGSPGESHFSNPSPRPKASRAL
eukprot:TRINITY_DN1218_c0_g1_i1.p1 TRINITY_DN1218_c0_g1~~TRINITY_DN1218_c0_g1_i1.p1  ORF type:complete len:539 (+),score=126.64 TRINITY_DN1218_c0_g1_i1:61-1617(+)